MKKRMLAAIAPLVMMVATPSAQADTLIPRSMSGDKGTYYLLEAKQSGGIVRAIHKRSGPSGTGYSKTETNCTTMKMRDLGYSEESPQAIKDSPSEWFDLVPGSSKADVARFVCRR